MYLVITNDGFQLKTYIERFIFRQNQTDSFLTKIQNLNMTSPAHSKYMKISTGRLMDNLLNSYSTLDLHLRDTTMSGKERKDLTISSVSVNVVFKQIQKDMLFARKLRSAVDENRQKRRQCFYISKSAESVGRAMATTINNIGVKSDTLTKTFEELGVPCDVRPCLLVEWVLSAVVPALISIVEMWDYGFKEMLKTLYFSYPNPTNAKKLKSLNSFATECNVSIENDLAEAVNRGGPLFLTNAAVQQCKTEYENRFNVDWETLKKKVLRIINVYDRIYNAFKHANAMDLCRTNGFLNTGATVHCDAVDDFIDKYNNVYNRLNERKLEKRKFDNSFLPLYEALFKVEEGKLSIETFDTLASRYFEGNSTICRAIQAIKAATSTSTTTTPPPFTFEEQQRQMDTPGNTLQHRTPPLDQIEPPPIPNQKRRPARAAAVAAAKSVTDIAQDEAPTDTDSDTDIEPCDEVYPPSDDDLNSVPSDDDLNVPSATPDENTNDTSTTGAVKKKTTPRAPAGKRRKGYVDPNGMTWKGDVDHGKTRAWQQMNSGEIYFHCPYCDAGKAINPGYLKKCRVISAEWRDNATATELAELDPDTCVELSIANLQTGARPVLQTIKQTACRRAPEWSRFRKHIQDCWKRRKGVHHPDQLASAEADILWLDRNDMIPELFKQVKVKYDKMETKTSTGKYNWKTYREKAKKRKEREMRAKIIAEFEKENIKKQKRAEIFSKWEEA